MKYDVIYRPFPTDDIFGAVMELEPNDFLILINSKLSDEKQKEALKHELYHIEHNHFELISKGELTMNQIESITHQVLEGR